MNDDITNQVERILQDLTHALSSPAAHAYQTTVQLERLTAINHVIFCFEFLIVLSAAGSLFRFFASHASTDQNNRAGLRFCGWICFIGATS